MKDVSEILEENTPKNMPRLAKYESKGMPSSDKFLKEPEEIVKRPRSNTDQFEFAFS